MRDQSTVRRLGMTAIFLLLLVSSMVMMPDGRILADSNNTPVAPNEPDQPQKNQGKGAASPSVWTKEIEIVRPALPGRPRAPRRVIRAPLLTLQFRVLKQGEDGSPVEINPSAIFFTGDQLQLRITPNQDGYLHIIQHTDGTDGAIIFPETRINEGKNYVKKNEELIIPSNCEEIRKDNCWFRVEPPTGREVFTIIFSREASPAIMEQIKPVGATVKLEEITRLIESPSKKTSKPNLPPEKGGGAGRYVIWVTNEDRRNNEELIARIVLNHQERSDGQ
jgi:hypothetical protein